MDPRDLRRQIIAECELKEHIHNCKCGIVPLLSGDVILNYAYTMGVQDSCLLVEALQASMEHHSPNYFLDLRFPQMLTDGQGPSETILEYLLRHTNRAKWDFYGLRRGKCTKLKAKLSPVLSALKEGRVQDFVALVRHGYGSSMSELIHEENSSPHESAVTSQSSTHALVARSVMKTLLNLRRLDKQINVENVCECFRMFSRSSASPFYVPSSETISVNANSAKGKVQSEEDSTANEISHLYEELFPEMSRGPLSPRPLVHLARCSVREALFRNWNLPEGISRLPGPKILKRYLDLKY